MPKSKAPEQTLEEIKYLQRLSEEEIPICVKLTTNEELRGVLEFFDAGMLRLGRDGEPNVFIYKHDIKYLYEETTDA